MPEPVFLITGASGSIGAATARAAIRNAALAATAAGYRAVCSGRRPDPLRDLAVSEIVIRPVGQDPFR